MNQSESKSILEQPMPPERAVLYARVSGDDRGKDNIAGQLEMGRQYAKEKGYGILAELAEDDRGASGAEINLPQLRRIRDMAQNDEFDVLIVRELDRLSRNLAKQLIVEDELKRAGARVEYILAEYQDSPEGRLNKHLRGTIAEYEREKIVERTNRAKRSRAQKGNVIMSAKHPPFGYKLVRNDEKAYLEVNVAEAGIVRLIFEKYVIEEWSLREIAHYLNELGIKPPKKSKSGKWPYTTVTFILRSETYVGNWYYGKHKNNRENWIKVNVPPIIPLDFFEAASRRLDEAKRRYRRKPENQYLLARRGRCGLCGSPIIGKPIKNKKYGKVYLYLYYFCGASQSTYKYEKRCTSSIIPAKKVDNITWNWIKDTVSKPEEALRKLFQAYRESLNEKNAPLLRQIQNLDELIVTKQKEYERVIDLYISGDFSKELLQDKKTAYERILKGLREERQKLVAQIKGSITDEQIDSIIEFARAMGEGAAEIDYENDFEKKRAIIEGLNVTITLTIENGEKILYTQCVLGDGHFSLEDCNTNCNVSFLSCNTSGA